MFLPGTKPACRSLLRCAPAEIRSSGKPGVRHRRLGQAIDGKAQPDAWIHGTGDWGGVGMRYVFGVLMLGALLSVVYAVNISQTCPRTKTFEQCAVAPIDGIRSKI